MKIMMPGGSADERPRSMAVSRDGRQWLLLNASNEAVHEAQRRAGRIAGVVLLDARLEHTAGLAALCGEQAVDVYTSPGVFERLAEAAPALGLLQDGCALRWHLLPIAGDVRAAEFHVPGLEPLRCRALAADETLGYGERLVIEVHDPEGGDGLFYAGGQPPEWLRHDAALQEQAP